jgi:hypothetical protein
MLDIKPDLVAFLPYVRLIFNCISGIALNLWASTTSFLQSVKDVVGLKTPGVYSIPCECGQICIAQMDRSIGTELKEHQWHIHGMSRIC